MLATALALCLFSPDFAADVRAAGAAYQPVREQCDAALVRAELAAAQQLFLERVAESERTAAHCFVLGNMWFDMDTTFALRMFECAATLAPDEPRVKRELALSLQRLGRHAEAEAVYATLPAAELSEPSIEALRAECLAHTGHYSEAAAAWARARSADDATAMLERALGWIHADEHPIARRARWVAELRAGVATHAEELVLADLFWRREGERYFVKYEYLEHDLALVRETLGVDSERAKDLSAIANFLFLDWEQRFPREADARPLMELRKAAAERRWVGESARLPESSHVAQCAIAALLESGEDVAPLLARHQSELVRRASAADGDANALEALLLLAERAKSPEMERWRALAKPTPLEGARAAVEAARRENRPRAQLLVAQIATELADDERDLAALDAAFADLATQSNTAPPIQRGAK